LFQNLPEYIANKVIALPAPIEADGPDNIGWGGTSTQQFSVKSAYNSLLRNQPSVEGDWKVLWRWRGPHRIQTFMWLVAHGRILTNYCRSRWGTGISPTCPCCGNADETVIHVLRDCRHASQVWTRLVSLDFITNFFSFVDCREWVFKNLGKRWNGVINSRWQTTFMTTCWHLWTWRNKAIFEEGFQRPDNPTYVIQKFIMSIEEVSQDHLKNNPHQRESVYIGWRRPSNGWVKLNCDGACKGKGELAGCGGILRQSDGRWIKGFSRKIGACDALHAEMWGLYLGLDMAWSEGLSHVIIESDSKVLIDMVTNNCKINGTIPSLVRRIQEILQRDWHTQVIHTWREGNRCADWLANFSLSLDSWNLVVLESPPNGLQRLIYDDISGACMPRNLRVI
jgi:ribonuclease HI